MDPVVKGEDGAIMRHIEERLNRFENKNTWWRHSVNGTMDDFDAAFDAAVERFENDVLGQDHPIFVGGEARQRDTFEMVSPADTNVVVGRYAKGTKQDVRDAIAISKERGGARVGG